MIIFVEFINLLRVIDIYIAYCFIRSQWYLLLPSFLLICILITVPLVTVPTVVCELSGFKLKTHYYCIFFRLASYFYSEKRLLGHDHFIADRQLERF